MGNIRRDLQKKNSSLINKIYAPKLDNFHNLSLPLKDDVYGRLNFISDELNITKQSIVREAVNAYLLQKNIQEILKYKVIQKQIKHKPKERAKANPLFDLRVNGETLQCLELFKKIKIPQSFIFSMAIDLYPIKEINADNADNADNAVHVEYHTGCEHQIHFRIDKARMEKVQNMIKTYGKKNKTYMLREMLESFLIHIDHGNSLEAIENLTNLYKIYRGQ